MDAWSDGCSSWSRGGIGNSWSWYGSNGPVCCGWCVRRILRGKEHPQVPRLQVHLQGVDIAAQHDLGADERRSGARGSRSKTLAGSIVSAPQSQVPDLPDQGPVCDHCGLHIPQFPELAREDDRRVRQLMRDGQQLLAMRELSKASGCPLTWAKVWVQHDGRTQPRAPGTTCTFCGGRLRTSLARQCLECGMDWHDPDRPRRLGTGQQGAAADDRPQAGDRG